MTTPVPNFPVPSFGDLMSDIAADFAGIRGLDALLPVGVIPVLIKILAKLAAGEYIYLAAFPNRALIPTLMASPYLETYAAGVGVFPDQATFSTGNVTFPGTNGITIPAEAQMTNSNGTVTLQTTAAATVSGGSVTVAVVALTPGSVGNLVANSPVTLSVGIAGILANGVVAGGGLSGGDDADTDPELQVKLGNRLSNPPQGGANADFVSWAELVAGVTRVWVYPAQNGAGTVVVQFMMDGRVNPIPLDGDVANVQDSIDAKAPVVGTYAALAPAAQAQAVTIASLAPAPGYTLSQAKVAAMAAIAALNYTTTPGGYGWDGQAENYLSGGTVYLEQIAAAIANAPSVATFDLTVPGSDVTAAYGRIVQFEAPSFP